MAPSVISSVLGGEICAFVDSNDECVFLKAVLDCEKEFPKVCAVFIFRIVSVIIFICFSFLLI